VEKKDYVLIGKIVGAHGIKGTNKICSYAESLTVFKPGRTILIRNDRDRETSYEINWVKPHTGTPLLSLKGVADRHQAEAMIGGELFIQKSELPELDEDTYYWFELIGIEVYTAEEQFLGRIESIVETGSNDVYVVKNGEKEVLIPALESVVLNVDLEHNIMRVQLPEGLIEGK
jgi:16S rRNA processing protein RimM